MEILIGGKSFALLPRIAGAVRLLIEHQGEIEQSAQGQIILDYSAERVSLSLRKSRGTYRIDKAAVVRVK